MALLAPPALAAGRRLLVAGLMCLLLSAAPAQTASREYQIKAVFLFNFTQFVEWPAASFPDSRAPLVIGVLGDDPFGALLETAIRNERAGEHPLEIRRFQNAAQADCHVLFISRSEGARLEAILSALADKPILTVSDTDNAARRGVMIRFLSENNRIRIRINLDSAKRAGLIISSKLLRSAEIVRSAP